MVSFDVNILLQALHPAHPLHDETRPWFERRIHAGPFGMSELVLSAFVRIATNRRSFPDGPTVDAALRTAERIRQHPNHIALRPGPRHFGLYAGLCREHQLTGKLTADAYHAALAIEHHCAFASYDRDFARFAPRLDWIHPGDETAAGGG